MCLLVMVVCVMSSLLQCHTVVLFTRLLFFFFKQKTAYEMRISDWSSDVCSSDLRNRTVGGTYFFTVNLAQRRGNRLLLEHVGALRAAFRRTCLERPFT